MNKIDYNSQQFKWAYEIMKEKKYSYYGYWLE